MPKFIIAGLGGPDKELSEEDLKSKESMAKAMGDYIKDSPEAKKAKKKDQTEYRYPTWFLFKNCVSSRGQIGAWPSSFKKEYTNERSKQHKSHTSQIP